MTTTATIIRSSAAVLLIGTGFALAQEPPITQYASDPANYVPALPGATVAKVVEPAGPVQLDRAWDGDKPFMPEMHVVQFPEPALPQDVLNALRPAAMNAFKLFDAHVLAAPVVEMGGERFVQVAIEGVNRIVRLHPHSMRADDAVLFVEIAEGVVVEEPWPAPATYRGFVEGAPEYEVAASIRGSEVSMTLLSLLPDDPSWFIQPLKDALPGSPDGLHVAYRDVDVMPRDAHCGWSDANPAPQLIEVPAQGAAALEPIAARIREQIDFALTTQRGSNPTPPDPVSGESGPLAVANVRCQIGLDADFEFFQANGSSVLNTIYDMELIMNTVGLVYQNQVGIAYTETIIFVRTVEPDPYTSTNPNTLICQFGEWWNTNVTTTRDVAHLFTGKDLDGTTVGFAWIGSICTTNFNNCNASGSSLSYGLVQSRFTTDLASRYQDSLHELGHNWNACHCNTGGNCGGGTSNPACGIMTSNISGQLTFDAAAVTAITSYRDGRPCLDLWYNPTYVNWAYGGVETGSITQPWNTIFEGLDASLVGGTLNVAGGNYFQNPNIFKAKNIFTTGGTVRIGSN